MIKAEKNNDAIEVEINGKGKDILYEFEALTEQMVETISTSMSIDKATYFIMDMIAKTLAKKNIEKQNKADSDIHI